MRCPSLTPAGMRTVMVRVWLVTPLPAHVGQGSSTTEPVPRQLRHGSEKAKAPWLRLVTPAPWQTGQVCGLVPGLAPLPWQVGQVPGLCMRSGAGTPRTASSEESGAPGSTACPRAGPEAAWLAGPARPRCATGATEEPAERVAEAAGAGPPAGRAPGGTEEVAEVEVLGPAAGAGEAARESAASAGTEQPPGVVVLGAALGV